MAIQFFLTDAGRAAGLDAGNLDLHVSLSHIAVGSGKYNAATAANTKTALNNELARYPLNGGGVEAISHTLRFVVNIEANITADIFELGLYTNTGVLFAVAAITGNVPLVQLVTNIVTILTIGMTLADIDVSTVQIVMDANSPVSVALMNQHLGHADDHPQYPLKSVLADIIYPVGSWHGNNNPAYNPATALQPLFGRETTWYLWPYVPAGVANTSAALGQIIPLAVGNGTLAATTRIWERLPDGANPPSYALTATQATVNEGAQVTFNLSTTGIAQGTPVAWNITGIQSADISPNAMSGQFIVGADGTATYSLTVIEDTVGDETETLKFALTYINNKFVNVVIGDTTLVEQVVTINSDTTDINLLQLFTSQYGAPTNKTRAVFSVQDNVSIIASTTLVNAVYGDHWPSGSTREIRVMPNAMIAGRGGRGGQAIDFDESAAVKKGGDGGTAIFAEADSPITVHNYDGLVAGGAGGGGASVVGKTVNTDLPPQYSALVIPGGGGAPFGETGLISYNRFSTEQYTAPPFMKGIDAIGRMIQFGWFDHAWRIDYEGDSTHYSTTTPPALFANATRLVGGPSNTASLVATTSSYESIVNGTSYTGGAGGAPGENGQAGSAVFNPPVGSAYWEILVAGGAGGLAGYIYQGPVTVINHGAGQSKGRTP